MIQTLALYVSQFNADTAQTFRAKDFKKQFTCAGQSSISSTLPLAAFSKKGGPSASVWPRDSMECTSVTANINLLFLLDLNRCLFILTR